MISQNFLKSLKIEKNSLKRKNKKQKVGLIEFVKCVSLQREIIIDYHHCAYTQHRIELKFEFLAFIPDFPRKFFPRVRRKKQREGKKILLNQFYKKISAILKNVHYVGLNEKIPLPLPSSIGGEKNIKVSSMFSNIGEWVFELYIERFNPVLE